MRIALFATCIVDAMYPGTARATVSILERLGHEVIFPAGQACCGQMHVNSGYFQEALPVIANHVKAFEEEEYDVAVAPSGSCVASVKHQHPMVARRRGDAGLEARAAAVGHKTYELSQLLVDVLGVTDAATQLGSYFPHRITYHPSCHGMRLLRLGDRQLDLLRSVGGIELADLPEAEQCCGFGGTFSMKNADVSSAMLADKTASICGTSAELLRRRRRVLPDAHRRRAIPAGQRRQHHALRRDPGQHGRASRDRQRRCPPQHRKDPTMSGTFLGMPSLPVFGTGNLHELEPFPKAARRELGNAQLWANLGHATRTIRDKRLAVVSELPDWEELREAGRAIKESVMARLPELLEQFEANFTARGGTIHWARDAGEANSIVAGLIRAQGVDEVVKVKSMATQEIGLNEYLEEHGIAAFETDLAELIVQLDHDKPSHILVPAIHKNRTQVRNIFLREMDGVDPELTDEPARLAAAARAHLRRKFLSAKVAVSGANFALADSGLLAVVESEGNGRMCLTLPEPSSPSWASRSCCPAGRTWRCSCSCCRGPPPASG
ncbi:MAG: (4Fe-4S) cluster-containing protein [Arthrobacter sp.]|nr:(4Fe-4S) cluster-containing protein [Arthrobacter sp.]